MKHRNKRNNLEHVEGTVVARRVQDKPLSKNYKDFARTFILEADVVETEWIDNKDQLSKTKKLESAMHCVESIKSEELEAEINEVRKLLAEALFNNEQPRIIRGQYYIWELINKTVYGSRTDQRSIPSETVWLESIFEDE